MFVFWAAKLGLDAFIFYVALLILYDILRIVCMSIQLAWYGIIVFYFAFAQCDLLSS